MQRWVINTLAVLVAANVVNGIHYDTLTGLVVASLLLGVLNSLLRPVMLLLSLPLLLATLGLFMLIINAALFYLVGVLVKSFHVAGFGAAFWGALVISVVSLVVNRLLGTQDRQVQVRWTRSRPSGRPPSQPGGSGGPVIDV